MPSSVMIRDRQTGVVMSHFSFLRGYSYFVVSMFALCLAAGAQAQNKLANGSFDRDLSGWEILGEATWSSLDARGGNSGSAQISSQGEIGFGELSQTIPVQPGERLRISASVLAQGATAGVIVGFCATINCVIGDEEPLSIEGFNFQPGAGFQTESVTTTSPAGTTLAAVFLYPVIQDLSTIYSVNFDDVVIASDNSPNVVVTVAPEAVVQTTGGGGTTSYTLQNVGNAPTQITLSQEGTFFQQSPASFTLAPGQSQVVTVTGLPSSAGSRDGKAIPRGSGVAETLSLAVRVLTSDPPGGPVRAVPSSNRVDLSSTPGGTSAGSISFTNSGTGTIHGTLISDVDWIIPQSGEVTIPPGKTVNATFTIDSSRRPDDGSFGSATGTLSLVYLNGSSGAKSVGSQGGPGVTTTSVSVVHTATPATASTVVPALPAGEVALFMPGVSHVLGSVGTFLSDVTLTNVGGLGHSPGATFFFRPLGNGSATTSTTVPPLQPNTPLTFSDIAKAVFGNSTSTGTLQLRSGDIDSISASATVLNSSNPKGTYGTSIPVFRSDHSSGAGESIFLTGLLSDATNHTNLYLQETSGGSVDITTEFLSSNGATLSSRTDNLSSFSAIQLGRVAPPGALAARINVTSASTGRLVSYATPVDDASGDTWAVVDWRRQYAYAATVPVVIPVAGSLRGANSTYFRTDLSMSNPGTTAASGRLRYYSRTGEIIDRNVSLAAGESRILSDVLISLFNASGDAVGYLEFTPSSGSIIMTSRTYTTAANSAATFGAAVPTLPLRSSLRSGQIRKFGGIDDAALATIQAGRPATFRTNVGLVEVSGQPATVRVTLRFMPSPRSAAQALVSQTFNLSAHQFLQINGITRALLGSSRDTDYGDLRNMQLEVEVTGGTGQVVPYTSSVDNGTGDSILRVD
ncbi:MAG: hypothetical protein ABI718_00870 [Acidobacteriota bacterium]